MMTGPGFTYPTPEQMARGQALMNAAAGAPNPFGFRAIAATQTGRYSDPTGFQEQQQAKAAQPQVPTLNATYPMQTTNTATTAPTVMQMATSSGGSTNVQTGIADEIMQALASLNSGVPGQSALEFPSIYNTDF